MSENQVEPSAPPTAVVFGSPVAVGHVRPLLPLAKRLVERGLAVVWAISGDDNEPASIWREPLEQLGVLFVDLDATAPFHRGRSEEFSSAVFRRILGRANDVAEGAAAAIASALAGRRAVCGVYDFFALWAYVAMRRLGIEDVVCVISSFPGSIDTLALGSYVDEPVYQQELAQLRRAGFGRFDQPLRNAVIPSDPRLRSVCFSSPHLCPEPPVGIRLLGVSPEALPQGDRAASGPPEHEALARQLEAARARGARVLLLSMGTIVIRMFARRDPAHSAFLKRLYTTLAASALRAGAVVVASTSHSSAAELGLDEAALGAVAAERVFALPFVPQPFLFARGLVDVMLMHGGANTFHETALAGIPVLVCPAFGDQASVAQAAARLGVGTCIESISYPGMAGAATLASIAEQVLPDMLAPGISVWKAQATRLALRLQQESGLDAAEKLLLESGAFSVRAANGASSAP